MSSADHYSPWGTPLTPPDGVSDASGSPAPPSMQSPYGMPLAGGPGGSGGPGGPGDFRGGPGGAGGPGGRGGSGGPGGPNRPTTPDDRRRKTLIASTLAAVAVLGIGGAAIAFTGGGDSPKQSSTALAATESSAGAGSTEGGAFPGAALSASTSGKPNGDTLPGGGVISNSDIPGGPAGTAGSSTGAPGSTPSGAGKTTTGPAKPGNPTLTGGAAKPSSSAPGNPATSKPGTTAPKPSTPGSTASHPQTSAPPPPPSTDCTYLNLPPQQMPEIKQGTANTNAVKQLQCLLKKSMLGIKPLVIDGNWGADTQSALTSFQSCNNAPTVSSPGGTPPYPKLALDGIAGQQTWADLYFWDNQYFNNVAYYCNGTR